MTPSTRIATADDHPSPRRAEILTIAADLFAEHGYAGVTVDDIGDAAGVSGPALYHHFTGKEALLGEMLVGISEYLLDGGRCVAEAGGDDTIERLVRFHAQFAVDDRSLITVHVRDLVHTSVDDHERVRALQNQYIDVWVDVIHRSRDDLDREVVRAGVHAVFGLINSTPHSARLERDHMVDLLCDLALGALREIIDGAPRR